MTRFHGERTFHPFPSPLFICHTETILLELAEKE